MHLVQPPRWTGVKNPKEQKMAARAPETATQWDSMRASALTSTVGSCSVVSAMVKEVGSSKGRPATRSRKGEKAGIRKVKRLTKRRLRAHWTFSQRHMRTVIWNRN